MNSSILFVTARLYGVPDEDAHDPKAAAQALAKIWAERGLSVEQIMAQTRLSRYLVEEIFDEADYELCRIARPKEMAGVA